MATKEARQAVSYALDRQAIMNSVYQGMYTPATSLVPPAIPGAYVKGCVACVNDPAKAKTLAAQAKLPPGSNVTLSLGDSATYTQLAAVVQQQLKTVLGWNVTLRKLPMTKIYTDEASKDAKDLYPLSWIADYPSGENFLYTLLSSDSIGGGNNFAKYHNPAFDSALSAARSTPDANQRIQKVRAAEKIALDDMALIPLYSHTVYRLADTSKFTNPGLDYLGYPLLTTTAHK
jgi:ABC-type oligopeptide transport system substrate-binding subunit